MSSGVSNSMRVFRGCRALLTPAKSTVSKTNTAATAATAAKSETIPKPKSKGKSVGSPTTTTTSSSPKPKVIRQRGLPTGILKLTQVSPALSNFLGVPEASRSDAVKQIWSYVKLHNLQNPADKREIHCDERLKTIFDGRDKVGFLEIGKLLSCHFVKTD